MEPFDNETPEQRKEKLPAMRSGIYEIRNQIDGKTYIGSAINLNERWRQHRAAFRRGDHVNKHLMSAWHRDGDATFTFKPLLICAPEHLLLFEQRCLDLLNPDYNMCAIAGSILGLKRSPETRARQSAAAKRHTGWNHTPEARSKIAAALVGRKGAKHTPEGIERIRVASSSRTHSLEARQRMAVSQRRRRQIEKTRPASKRTFMP